MKMTEEDFTAIYHSTYTHLRKFILFKTDNIQDGEELIQNVYLDFYRYVVKEGKSVDNALAYLMGMAKHEIGRYYKNKAKEAITFEDQENTLLDQIPDDLDLEAECLESLTIEEIWESIQKLSPLDQKILIGRYRFDLSYREIAEQLAMPETTIKSRIYKSIERLKEKYHK